MSNRQAAENRVKNPMRPNIRISHALNGRVKDYAAEHNLDTSEAYKQIIEAGLESLEQQDHDREDAPPDEAVKLRKHPDRVRERAKAALDELDVPGRDPAVERNRREAIMWAWDYLRRHGDATSSEIANATFGYFWDVDLGYSVSSRYPGYGLWDNCVRDVLAELPGVDAPAEKGSEWSFVKVNDE